MAFGFATYFCTIAMFLLTLLTSKGNAGASIRTRGNRILQYRDETSRNLCLLEHFERFSSRCSWPRGYQPGFVVTLTETPPFPAHVGKCTGNQDQSCVVHVVVRRVIHWPNGTISKNMSPCIFTSQIPGTL